jgi:Glycosyl transferase family 2
MGTPREGEAQRGWVTAPGRLPAGSIDEPARGSSVERGQVLASGWALGSAGPLDSLLVVVDDRAATPTRPAFSPLEVATRYSDVPRSGHGGWDAIVDLRGVEGPTATLALVGRTANGTLVELDAVQVRVDPYAHDVARRAVFTIVQNEPTFLPLWVRYYSRHFDPADIYVLDHGTTDGSTEGLGGCHVIEAHRDRSFDHAWLKGTVEDFQAFLLRSYDAVLFAEADEFVVPDPDRYRNLAAYIDALEAPAACCTGYNVVHYPDEEPPLRFGELILRQRRWWHPSRRWYSKRLLARAPLSWSYGFHDELIAPFVRPDPALFLVHLHRVDYDYCLARHRSVTERRWYAEDRRRDLGRHYRVVDPVEFRDWFFAGYDLEGTEREPIPERIRAIF